jgi:hypothetical protein
MILIINEKDYNLLINKLQAIFNLICEIIQKVCKKRQVVLSLLVHLRLKRVFQTNDCFFFLHQAFI